MAAIINKQHIEKRTSKQRRKHSSFKPINKSAGFNDEFMSQFKQHPARSRRKKHSLFPSFSRFFSNIHLSNREKPAKIRKEKTEKNTYKTESKKSGGSGFSLPALPTLAVIAGTVVIALAALNWEDVIITENIVILPGEDTEAVYHTWQYASTGITQILPQQIQPETLAAEENQDTADLDITQDDLIPFQWEQYRVRRGDSVSEIAKRFGVSVGAIIASNEIRNARTMQEGITLRIPNIDGIPYQVKSGDNLLKISASFNVPLEVILDVNDIKSDNIRTGETIFIPGARMNDIDLRMSLGDLFIYPIQNRGITSHFGMRKDPISGVMSFHTGIDLRADIGTTIVAALDGVVSVTSENRIYGRYIIMSHVNGYKTLYAHLNTFSVKQGDRVARGRKIGESGNTGYSTGPHLHFSIYDKNNKLVNPLDLLR